MDERKKICFVVRGLVACGGRFLLLRRSDQSRPGLGLWELPGGRVQFGEAPEAALVRLVRELTGLEARPVAPLAVWHEMKDARTQFIGFTSLCVTTSDKVRLTLEHERHAWAGREQLGTYQLHGARAMGWDAWDWRELEDKARRAERQIEREAEAHQRAWASAQAEAQAAAQQAKAAASTAKAHQGNQADARQFPVGQWVKVDGMAGAGRIVEVDERRRQARVLVGDKEWVLAFKKLTPTAPPAKEKEPEPPPTAMAYLVGGGSAVVHEIDLHGLRVEEAMELVERTLDQAVVNHLPQVKFIHGHGTGALRNAVRQRLAHHPLVTRYRFGGPAEGGLACTVAEIRL